MLNNRSSESAEKFLTPSEKNVARVKRAGCVKHLSLIHAIMLLHEEKCQKRSSKQECREVQQFEVTSRNIGLANKLAHQILRRTLRNIPPRARLLYLLVQGMVDKQCVVQQISRADCRLSYKHIKECTCWSNAQLKVDLNLLEQKQYIYQEGRGVFRFYRLGSVDENKLLMRIERVNRVI